MRVALRCLSMFLGALFALSACSPFTILNTTIGEDGFTVHSGLRFGPQARQVLDVYVPEQRDGPLPVVVFFYGGSWRGGERADYRFAADALASRGYVAIVPDYRLFPEVRFPAFVEDGAKAVRWVLEHVADFGGDPDRLYLMGHSAGAHIAAMLTLDERYLAAEGVPRHSIRGTIALAGPYAFYPSRTASVAPIFSHLADQNTARPIVFVDGDEAPMLLLHGADDDTVFVFNTVELSKTVRDAGGSARQIIYPDVGHFEILLALARPFRGIAPVLSDTAAFIDGQRPPSAGAQ
jgi:acetyl esterase/lipase